MKSRSTVSPALDASGVSHFAALLNSFRLRLPRTDGAIVRFEYLLDEMFDVFVSLNRELGPEGQVIDCFPPLDNFDTGNACCLPFLPFVEGVREAFADLDLFRGYFGPRPIDGLEEAVKAWLIHHGFISSTRSCELSLAVGAGTVNLYDSLCRLLLRRPGDIVVIPDVTYGYFLPHVERSGGQLEIMRLRSGVRKVTEADAVAVIEECNRVAARNWLTISQRLDLYLAEIHLRFPQIRQPRSDELSGLRARLASYEAPGAVQVQIEEFVYSNLCDHDEVAARNAIGNRRVMSLLPSRVVAYVHINPTLYGEVYDEPETAALTSAIEALDVSMIEDVAYHSLGRSIGSLRSCLCYGTRSFSLLGLSKPLGIANCRLGLLLGDRKFMPQLYRVLENSVGFVSTLLQRGLLRAFRESTALDNYLQINWESPDHGYLLRQNVLLACLEGCASTRIKPPIRENVLQRVREAANDFFSWKRRHGIELFDPDYPFKGGRPAISANEFQQMIVDEFLEIGLSHWLEICATPDCGFFVIVDCRRMINAWAGREPHLTCAFDVFALFAVLFGVRTIPEECMGDLNFAGGQRLRISYSVPIATIVRACLTLYIGIPQAQAITTK